MTSTGAALARTAERLFRRFRRTDGLRRRIRVAICTSVDLSAADCNAVLGLLDDRQAWKLAGLDTVEHLAARIAACLPPRDGRTPEDSRAAALTIARRLLPFAVADLDQKLFQYVLLNRIQQIGTDQASALEDSLSSLHSDIIARFNDGARRLEQVAGMLPRGSAPEPTPKNLRQAKERNKHIVLIERMLSLCLLAVSAVLSSIAFYFRHHLYPLGPGLLLLAALALSSFLIRGPRRRNGLPITVCACVLFVVQLITVIAGAVTGMRTAQALAPLLQLTALGVLGVGLGVFIVVTWRSEWPFSEPLALGVVAVWLGILCLSAFPNFAKPLHFPATNGAALLYATGNAHQDLQLNASILPYANQPNREFITIRNNGVKHVHWVLVLTHDARLTNVFVAPANAKPPSRGTLPNPLEPADPEQAQIFSGSLGFDSQISINGSSVGRFATSTSDRKAVSLPTYGQGDILDASSEAGSRIAEALGTEPTLRSFGHFTVVVEGDALKPFESVTQSVPAPDSNLGNPTFLQWTSYTDLSVFYATVDQDEVDATNNVLFVFAILLGVAGSGAIASLQTVIHSFVGRKHSAKPAD